MFSSKIFMSKFRVKPIATKILRICARLWNQYLKQNPQLLFFFLRMYLPQYYVMSYLLQKGITRKLRIQYRRYSEDKVYSPWANPVQISPVTTDRLSAVLLPALKPNCVSGSLELCSSHHVVLSTIILSINLKKQGARVMCLNFPVSSLESKQTKCSVQEVGYCLSRRKLLQQSSISFFRASGRRSIISQLI